MLTIYKYPVQVQDKFTITMPFESRVLCVQVQRGEPFIWACVETNSSLVSKEFYVRGTGHNCEEVFGMRYIGTFQLEEGSLVFHLFEK